jgi:hypothetical protein
MVFNATFNNISVISWWSLLLVEETRVPGENHRPATSHWQTLSHNVVSSTYRHEWDSNSQLYTGDKQIAQVVVNCFPLNSIKSEGLNYTSSLSTLSIPDEGFYSPRQNTFFLIENTLNINTEYWYYYRFENIMWNNYA